ncbi:hypothetical protein [Pseudonocardia sp. T1-2H]|uniref:hypothetical protein n=1 Tax=Pseudonocardia sp. T1-2H TaxID=3128899 RepID=UPI00310118D0
MFDPNTDPAASAAAAAAYAAQSTETCDHGRLLWQSCSGCGVLAWTPPAEEPPIQITERPTGDGGLHLVALGTSWIAEVEAEAGGWRCYRLLHAGRQVGDGTFTSPARAVEDARRRLIAYASR